MMIALWERPPFGWELGRRVFNPSPARPKDTRQSVKKGNKRVSQRVALILGRRRPPRRATNCMDDRSLSPKILPWEKREVKCKWAMDGTLK